MLPIVGEVADATKTARTADRIIDGEKTLVKTADVVDDSKAEIENPKEYLEDLLQYVDKKFEMEESDEVLKLIISFLQYAIETNQTVLVEVV